MDTSNTPVERYRLLCYALWAGGHGRARWRQLPSAAEAGDRRPSQIPEYTLNLIQGPIIVYGIFLNYKILEGLGYTDALKPRRGRTTLAESLEL